MLFPGHDITVSFLSTLQLQATGAFQAVRDLNVSNVKIILFPLSPNTFLFEEVSVYPSLFQSILPQIGKSHTTPYH